MMRVRGCGRCLVMVAFVLCKCCGQRFERRYQRTAEESRLRQEPGKHEKRKRTQTETGVSSYASRPNGASRLFQQEHVWKQMTRFQRSDERRSLFGQAQNSRVHTQELTHIAPGKSDPSPARLRLLVPIARPAHPRQFRLESKLGPICD
jgi:hypothetical protein